MKTRTTVLTITWDDDVADDPSWCAELSRDAAEVLSLWDGIEEVNVKVIHGDLPPDKKDPDAVSLGRRGGQVGGHARAAAMTPQERSDASRRAANLRWHGEDELDDDLPT